jgi:hypothetical protein
MKLQLNEVYWLGWLIGDWVSVDEVDGIKIAIFFEICKPASVFYIVADSQINCRHVNQFYADFYSQSANLRLIPYESEF